jgi:hypothetical protein
MLVMTLPIPLVFALEARFARYIDGVVCLRALQADGRGLSIIRRNAQWLGEHQQRKDEERYASIENCNSAHPLDVRKPIFFRPVGFETRSHECQL